jgi:hypothetical protein
MNTHSAPGTFVPPSRPCPEIQAELLSLQRAEDCRRRAWLRDRHALAGVGDVLPESFTAESDADLLTRAAARVGERRRWRESPEGRFLSALGEAESVVAAAQLALQSARAAAARAFASEAALCRAKADELFSLSSRLKASALDASLAADAA